MYLYFDKNRVLKEIINDSLVSVGDSDDKIYIYVEDIEPNKAWYRFQLPNKEYLPPLVSAEYETTTVVTKKLEYNKKRDLKYFNYNDSFKFIVIELTKENTYNALSEEGLVSLTVRVNDDGLKALGLIVFNVEYSVEAGANKLEYDGYVNIAQFNYLLDLIDEANYLRIFEFSNSTTLAKITATVTGAFILKNNNAYYVANVIQDGVNFNFRFQSTLSNDVYYPSSIGDYGLLTVSQMLSDTYKHSCKLYKHTITFEGTTADDDACLFTLVCVNSDPDELETLQQLDGLLSSSIIESFSMYISAGDETVVFIAPEDAERTTWIGCETEHHHFDSYNILSMAGSTIASQSVVEF